MASEIAAQLQALKYMIQTDSEPNKRPFTRPSIIFDPKEAADVDIDTIFRIALSGNYDFANPFCPVRKFRKTNVRFYNISITLSVSWKLERGNY